MRIRIFFAVATLTLLVTGCSSKKHPSFSAFQKVPASELSSFKTDLKELPIKNIELPTKLPFTVSHVSIVPSVFGMKENVPVTIKVGGDERGVNIVAAPDSKSTSSTMGQGTITKLSNGTKAIYRNDGHALSLDWAKDGVEYTLSSSNLTEKQLIQIANSFR